MKLMRNHETLFPVHKIGSRCGGPFPEKFLYPLS